MQWWREARFGMFIHWGVYAVNVGPTAEGEFPQESIALLTHLLANGNSLKTNPTSEGIQVELPAKPTDTIATVTKVEVKGT